VSWRDGGTRETDVRNRALRAASDSAAQAHQGLNEQIFGLIKQISGRAQRDQEAQSLINAPPARENHDHQVLPQVPRGLLALAGVPAVTFGPSEMAQLMLEAQALFVVVMLWSVGTGIVLGSIIACYEIIRAKRQGTRFDPFIFPVKADKGESALETWSRLELEPFIQHVVQQLQLWEQMNQELNQRKVIEWQDQQRREEERDQQWREYEVERRHQELLNELRGLQPYR
jgi:hypothetical protein